MLRVIGPGLVVAATGVGAGDMVSAGKAGAAFGYVVLWAVVVGTVLKFVLAEGIARWQLVTGEVILATWARRFAWPVRAYFFLYLLIWTQFVSAALLAGAGLAAHALVPGLSVAQWGALHGLLAAAFVWAQGYGVFERAMQIAIGVMFVAIVGTALIIGAPPAEVLQGAVIPRVPDGSVVLLLGVVGGVGGTLTLLSYSYWMAEKGWQGREWLRAARVDLSVGYLFTGIFGIALVVLAALELHPRGIEITGSKGILQMAGVLGERFGQAGQTVFLVGFWAAVASSALGVWQGVPYLFDHFVRLRRERDTQAEAAGGSRLPDWEGVRKGWLYRGYVLFMTFPPMILLFMDRPVWLVVLYAAIGSLFMPFLAGTLLVLGNDKALGDHRNGWKTNLALVVCLLLFASLAVIEIQRRVF